MPAFQFPDHAVEQSVVNPTTGTKYKWKANPGKWVIESGVSSGGGDNNFALPYQLTVGKRDSVTGEDISTFQSLETVTLKDASGNNLGDVAFESAGGLGIAIDNSYDYPVITFQTSNLQNTQKVNKGRIYSEELRSAIVPKTYDIVNRTGVPTARPGELSINATKANEITAISFGETTVDGLPIGNVSVGDKLSLELIENGRRYFYSITSGTSNSGIYGVEFIPEDSWALIADITQKPHYLEIFPKATPFGSSINLENYYNKSEVDAKFAAGLLPGDVDASDYWTKTEVAAALESVRASLQTNINTTNDLIIPPGQNNPETYYGDYAPTGNLLNGDMWFDAMNLRLNVWSQGAWVNPDRNDGADSEDRISALEVRIAQLESN